MLAAMQFREQMEAALFAAEPVGLGDGAGSGPNTSQNPWRWKKSIEADCGDSL